MAQELNLIEKSPLFHNPYVFKEDQQVKMIINTPLSSFLFLSIQKKQPVSVENLQEQVQKKKSKEKIKKKRGKKNILDRIFL